MVEDLGLFNESCITARVFIEDLKTDHKWGGSILEVQSLEEIKISPLEQAFFYTSIY